MARPGRPGSTTRSAVYDPLNAYGTALAPARDLLVWVLRMVLACLLTALILLEVVQVSLRYVFSDGLIWGRDVSTLLLFSIAWFGAPLCWLKASHIAVDLLPRLQAGRRVLRFAIDLIALAFSLALLVFLGEAYRVFSFLELPSLGVAASVKFVPIIAGTALLTIAALLNMVCGPQPEPDGNG